MDKKYFEDEIRKYLKNKWYMGDRDSEIKGVGFDWDKKICEIRIYGDRYEVRDLFRYARFGHRFWEDIDHIREGYSDVSFTLAIAGNEFVDKIKIFLSWLNNKITGGTK